MGQGVDDGLELAEVARALEDTVQHVGSQVAHPRDRNELARHAALLGVYRPEVLIVLAAVLERCPEPGRAPRPEREADLATSRLGEAPHLEVPMLFSGDTSGFHCRHEPLPNQRRQSYRALDAAADVGRVRRWREFEGRRLKERKVRPEIPCEDTLLEHAAGAVPEFEVVSELHDSVLATAPEPVKPRLTPPYYYARIPQPV